ncbi:PH domain-containing protein [Flavobacterium sp. N1718]|uniref:PH domain-containing protein n=2 Tax=unclassified Flavobacterium TaxID=196869 RepID=UPI0022243341|nr:PH domain-containing protein [Flavobacterium sp. N1718]
MVFKASMDRSTRISTIVVTVLFAALPVAGLFMGITSGNWTLAAVGCLLLVVYGIVYAYRPTAYEITAHGLLIHRPAGVVKIASSRIRQVQPLEKAQVRFALRTFGVGGLFGYFGSFYTKSLGSMTWYLTRLDALVLIETDREKLVLSPNDRDAFLQELSVLS